jgi:hypothetical protein
MRLISVVTQRPLIDLSTGKTSFLEPQIMKHSCAKLKIY